MRRLEQKEKEKTSLISRLTFFYLRPQSSNLSPIFPSVLKPQSYLSLSPIFPSVLFFNVSPQLIIPPPQSKQPEKPCAQEPGSGRNGDWVVFEFY